MTEIEYFYSAHSAFAYIGHARLLEIRDARGCRLVHRPIDLRPVVEAAGAVPFAARTKRHVDYYFGREIERWSQFRGVEILDRRPTHHDNPLALSNGLLIAAILDGEDVDALSHALLEAHWRDDIDLADPDALRRAAGRISPRCADLVDRALDEDVQAIHAANTREAIERGVFGSPTYFLDGDMHYGQDHLELLDAAFDRPFRPHAFSNPAR